MPKKIIPDPCPYCGIQPMIWVTPKGSWHLACKNMTKSWHPNLQGRSLTERNQAIKNWNEIVDTSIEFGAYELAFKEREISPQNPHWIKIKDTFYSKCSNCGYELAPELPTCPGCRKRMIMK